MLINDGIAAALRVVMNRDALIQIHYQDQFSDVKLI